MCTTSFHAINCDKSALHLLQEFQPVLGYSLQDNGIPFTARHAKDEPGFHIQKNSTIHITYSTCVDFGRALLAVCANSRGSAWELQEKCSFQELGVSLDLSRNAVMRPAEIRRFLRLAALMGYHFVGLYLEDTLQVEKEPCFGYMRGAITPGQLKELDHYAESLGIELRAYLQTLAHLNQITRYNAYEPIIDTGDILLAGDERTYLLLDHLLGTISGCLRCRKVNIGMDEAELTGLGKYLKKNGYHSRTDVLLLHLNRVLEICKKYGLQAQMWSDLFFQRDNEHYLENDTQTPPPAIPNGLELAYWDYYSTNYSHYNAMLKKHLQITRHVAFAGGAWKWTGFTPHNHYSIETATAALAACRDNCIPSVLITTWGDNGAEASVFSVLPALFADAQMAYGAPQAQGRFECLTGIPFAEFLAIDLPCRFSSRGGIHNNASKFLLFQDVLYGTFDSLVTDSIPGFYEQAANRLQPLCENPEFGYLFQTQKLLCQVLAHKASLGKELLAAYRAKNKDRLRDILTTVFPPLLSNIAALYEAFRAQWLRENTPFGFEVQTIRFGGLQARLLHVQTLVQDYLEGRLPCIEELEIPRIPFAYTGATEDIEQLNYNLWSHIVSPGVIG